MASELKPAETVMKEAGMVVITKEEAEVVKFLFDYASCFRHLLTLPAKLLKAEYQRHYHTLADKVGFEEK